LLADLKRQETLLHERERVQQGADALQRIEQKTQERQQRQEDIQTQDGAARAQDKLQEQQNKQAEHAAIAASDAAPAPAPASAPSPAGPTATEQTLSRADYERKQVDAEKKRQELIKRQTEKTGKPSKPLPVPP
jgi:hypothetical protein